jgi:molecular chaperone DnaK (HSP70)
MKKIILSAIVLATGLTACNSNKDEKASSTNKEVTHVENQDEKQQVDAPQKEVAKDTTTTIENTQSTLSTDEIVKNYLKLKNALAKDDSQSAAKAAKALISSFNNSNYKSIEAKLKKEYLDIADDAKEHAEHIYKNAEDIEHQREHFAILSKDVSDLIKTFGSKKKLYQDFCPMYDEGKGAIWISETKEIKNPYYGSEMPTCGSIKKVY